MVAASKNGIPLPGCVILLRFAELGQGELNAWTSGLGSRCWHATKDIRRGFRGGILRHLQNRRLMNLDAFGHVVKRFGVEITPRRYRALGPTNTVRVRSVQVFPARKREMHHNGRKIFLGSTNPELIGCLSYDKVDVGKSLQAPISYLTMVNLLRRVGPVS